MISSKIYVLLEMIHMAIYFDALDQSIHSLVLHLEIATIPFM